MNTVVLRPKLLIKVQSFKELGIPGFLLPGDVNFSANLAPDIQPVRSAPEKQHPDQARIRIPLSKLPKGAPACGIVISMGWADPTNELAKKVKKVQVTFNNVRQLDKSGARFLLLVAAAVLVLGGAAAAVYFLYLLRDTLNEISPCAAGADGAVPLALRG